jgi:CubicO group peptidase (beta-lactamase class C family)
MQRLTVLLLVMVLLAGLIPARDVQGQTDAPYWPTEIWRTAVPEAQGVDSEVLVTLLERIAERETDIDSLLIVRHGYLVLEAYWHPYDANTRHELASVAKSVTSGMVGAAIQQGYIAGVDQPLIDFFPDLLDASDEQAAITLEDMLTMRAGLRCLDETDTTVEAMQRTDDWAAYMLSRAVVTPPGRTFNYCNGVSHVLSVLVGRATGQPTMDFARAHLFEPIGMTSVSWFRDPDGNPTGGWGLALTPRDMARFGYLYLREGAWDGTQILPPEWVTASAQSYTYSPQAGQGYGYQWWTNTPNSFEAVGAGGQYIFVRRASDLVVVMTSDIYSSNYTELLDLMNDYVSYAAWSREPLDPNPEAVAALEALVAAAAEGDE